MKFTELKVVELATVLAGPSVGMFFAELGAKVIKIENPLQPDVTRSWKAPNEVKESAISAYFSSINYKKEYRFLNIKVEEDFQQLLELVADADILISNFKKGAAERLKLDDKHLFALNPRLIHGKISGFGSASDRVAYDLIVQAESGFMSMNGSENDAPTKMPVALMDVLTSHQLKEGILCALLERETNNVGKIVEVSLYDTAVCSLVNQATAYLMTGKIPQRIGSKHPNIAPYGELFQTKDEQTITFAIGSDTHFQKLLTFLNLSALSTDERFLDNQSRVKNRSVLAEILQAQIAQKMSAEILTWGMENAVPCGQIKNLEQVFAQTSTQRLIREETIDGISTKRVTSIAFLSKSSEDLK